MSRQRRRARDPGHVTTPTPVTPHHAAALATIHAAAFAPGERWRAEAFAELLASPGVGGLVDGPGFVLVRKAGGEAEVLTLAVAPPGRQQGLGRRLLAAAVDALACPVFLEVAADNAPALQLYRSAGFAECGRRRAYYGPGRDALVLRRLPPPG